MNDSFPLRNWEETLQESVPPKPNLWSRVKDRYFKAVGLKMADDFVPASTLLPDSLPRTKYPYGRDIREGLDSNVIMSPVSWVTRNFTEAEPVVERRLVMVDPQTGLGSVTWGIVPDHPLVVLLDAPNRFYDGDTLWKSTLVSFLLDGNAYWLKVRNAVGGVVELWYAPHFLMEPQWPHDGSVFISHYEYRPWWGGNAIDLAPEDVVHFRSDGLDPRNPRKGLSKLRMLLREIFTDEEAANFSASILRNMGVPGGVMSPKDKDRLPDEKEVDRMKQHLRDNFTGDRRGEWFVTQIPTEINQFGFDPQQLMLANLRDISEERVCSAIGIPAAVVGFGAGLQQTKVGATMKELRRSAWVNCIIPNQTTLGRQATRQLMPDFQTQTRRFRVRFDTSGVSAFVEEETEKTNRITSAVSGSVMKVSEGRDALGLPPDPTQDVYLRPSNMVEVGPDGVTAPTPPSDNGGRPPVEESASETNGRANRVLAALEGR